MHSPLPHLLLLLSVAATAAAAGLCDAPFKTLSSDCRGVGNDNGKRACVVVEGSAGEPCDLRTYRLQYTPTSAQFRITFQGEASPRRLLALGDEPPQLGVDDAGSGSAGERVIPTTTTPTATPSKKPDGGRWVDYPPVPATPPPTNPSPTFVDSPPRPPTGNRETRLPPTAPGESSRPSDPSTPISHIPAPAPIVDYNPSTIATESNEFIDVIGRLEVPPALAEVHIYGGTNEIGTTGKTVKLTIDPQMLTLSKSVTSLSISNCDIGGQLATGSVLSAMPTGMTELYLRNTLLRVEPNDLSALRNLRSLTIKQNYLSSWTKKSSLPELTTLDLTENDLTVFEATYPKLNVLNLNKNKLKSIPASIFSMTNLQELHLSENPIVAIVVSEAQYAFLTQVRLIIDKPPTIPPQPVVYVPTPTSGLVPSDATSLILNSKNVDFANAVGVPVGTSKSVGGFPVWTLPNGVHEVFVAQQEVLSKSNVVIGGKKAQTYHDLASSLAPNTLPSDKSSSTSSDNSFGGTDEASLGANLSTPTRDVITGITGNTNPANDGKTTSTDAARTPSTANAINQGRSKATNLKTLIISLAAVVAAAILLTLMLYVCHRRRNTNKPDHDSFASIITPQDGSSLSSYQSLINSKSRQKDSMGSFGSSFIPTQDADLRDLLSSRRIRTTDLEDVRPITSTGTDVTWLVKMRGSRLLTSKRMIESAATPMRITEFVNEIIIAADLDHPSIVRLVGVAWTSETDLQALYEYMPNGDLETYLQKTERSSLLWSPTKLKLAIDIAEALVYTHSFNPPLLHRDLRARNVSLDEEMNHKLSNFGSARFASEDNTMTNYGIGSGRWLAPEILDGRTDYDAASDVYAFGVLLHELDSHTTPYADVCDVSGNPLEEIELLHRIASGELRPSFSCGCPPAVIELAVRCMSQEPTSRPSAIQIAYELRVMNKALA